MCIWFLLLPQSFKAKIASLGLLAYPHGGDMIKSYITLKIVVYMRRQAK